MEIKNYDNLKDWHDDLPAKNQKEKLTELAVALGLSYSYIMRNWINGGIPPKVGYRPLIEKVTGCIIYYNDTPKTAKVA